MMRTVEAASREKQLALVRAHPELAGGEALTVDSTSEQARLGFNRLTTDELERMNGLNRRYREKFGFPCIVALRLHANRESVMREMERRLGNNADTELTGALEQIGHITHRRAGGERGREPGPAGQAAREAWLMGSVTSHALDTAHSRAGGTMTSELCLNDAATWKRLKSVTSNQDGLSDEPLRDGALR